MGRDARFLLLAAYAVCRDETLRMEYLNLYGVRDSLIAASCLRVAATEVCNVYISGCMYVLYV